MRRGHAMTDFKPSERDDGLIDWITDFDILDESYVEEPAAVWRSLRAACPVAHTDRYGSTWLPVDYDDLASIAHDVERFSSRDVAAITPGRDSDPEAVMMLEAPPITSDPPVHASARRLLLPRFGPSAVGELTPITAGIADALIDDFLDAGAADSAAQYAQHIPVQVISRMIGLPLEDETMFTEWVVDMLQGGFQNIEKASESVLAVIRYFEGKLEERVEVPPAERPDDLLTLLIEAEHEGAPLTDRHRIGSCFLLLVAGIDTTWSSIGSALWHLATHPEDQARLRAEPELMDCAIEEFLRFYSPVTMARYVVDDTEFGGCPMKRGEKVLMAFPAGNRDPAHFDRADEFVIDRQLNRHFAFGSGIHRCLGSNLARMELRVAIERFLARVPTFELTDPGAVSWTGGQVRGPRAVPVAW